VLIYQSYQCCYFSFFKIHSQGHTFFLPPLVNHSGCNSACSQNSSENTCLQSSSFYKHMEMSHFSIATLTLDKCIFLLGDLDTCIIFISICLRNTSCLFHHKQSGPKVEKFVRSQVITIPKKYLRSYDSEVDSGH
jgi:hypothetical protein